MGCLMVKRASLPSEVQKKIAAYQTSDAPHDVKEKAIQDLLSKYKVSTDTAMVQFLESRADIGGGDE
jgi:hypothetical protein